MNTFSLKMIVIWTLLIFISSLSVNSQDSLGISVLKETKINGGIALVIGAESLDLAFDLAKNSQLYIQLLQPDLKKVSEWNIKIAQSEFREKVGVRSFAFNSEHYGSNLFNLVLVENVEGLNGVKADELLRILVPRGFCLAKPKVSSEVDQIELLTFDSLKSFSYETVFRKKVKEIVWAPADSLKWRAGPRAHINLGFMGTVHGSGKFIYRELMESKGTFPNTKCKIFARDEFNGRTLWVIDEPAGIKFSNWGASTYSTPGHSMVIDDNNQFFYINHENKLVCLDAETGVLKKVLNDGNVKGQNLSIDAKKYLVCSGDVYSTITLEKIFSFKGKNTVSDEKLYTINNGNLTVYKLKDGAVLLEKKLDWLDDKLFKKSSLTTLANQVLLIKAQKWERPFTIVSIDKDTGDKKWSLDLQGLFALPPRGEKGKTYFGTPTFSEYNGKILAHTIRSSYYGESQEGFITTIEAETGKVEEQDAGYNGKLFGNSCGSTVTVLGDYIYYWHNVWYDMKEKKKIFPYLVHPSCFLVPSIGEGYVYNLPSRKGGVIEGVTAIGPSDTTYDKDECGEVLQSFSARPTFKDETKETDWPMYRNNSIRSNSVSATNLGADLKLNWSTKISLGEPDYDVSLERRTGLTQASIAYDMAFVAAIDSQCVTALDVHTGKTIWSVSIGSRVDFTPSIYKGLCFVAGKDGWVYCLHAKTGELVYKVMASPTDRMIGGQEKLESLWPTVSDVFVQNGVGYISTGFGANSHGGCYFLSFDAETGKKNFSIKKSSPDNPDGYPRPGSTSGLCTGNSDESLVMIGGLMVDATNKDLIKSGQAYKSIPGPSLKNSGVDDLLAYGNSLGRNNEDRTHAGFSDGRAKGKSLSFDKGLSVIFSFKPKGESFVNAGEVKIIAIQSKKEATWSTDPIDLIVDDMILSPKFVYVVGHYQRGNGNAELWVMNRENGQIIKKIPLDDMASFNGMSLGADKLFIAARNGKLICLDNK